MRHAQKRIVFFETGASVNLLKSSRRAIGGAASAIRRYTSICEIKGIRSSPVKENMCSNGAHYSTKQPLSNNT